MTGLTFRTLVSDETPILTDQCPGSLPLNGGTDDLADILSLLTQSTQGGSTMYQ